MSKEMALHQCFGHMAGISCRRLLLSSLVPPISWCSASYARIVKTLHMQEAHMRGFVKRCSHMARMFSIGTSAHGRDLWALELSEKPGLAEAKPNAKYVANMHGDEPSGRCAALACMQHIQMTPFVSMLILHMCSLCRSGSFRKTTMQRRRLAAKRSPDNSRSCCVMASSSE